MTPQATVEDFLKSFDADEGAELSNLNLPGDPNISREKIEYQLQLAAAKWLGWFGKKSYDDENIPNECLGNAITCECDIARYALDYNSPRDDSLARRDFCYTIVRDWKKDRLAEAKLDLPTTTENSPIMSAFVC